MTIVGNNKICDGDNFQNRFFFYVLTIGNDQLSDVNHVLDPLCVLFTLFGCWRGDGGLLNDFATR